MEYKQFRQIDLNDSFFDSLKSDYLEFEDWYKKKAEQGAEAYVAYDNSGKVQAFLYVKIELSEITDVNPVQQKKKWLKVGTFKVIPHGTKLGERFIKKILDYAIINKVDSVYLTIFPRHQGLIRLLTKYGFEKKAEKLSANGTEDVLVKDINSYKGDALLDYPSLNTKGNKKYILSIYPSFHTQLFPDSKLFNETYDLIQDVSHTNSIHKVYICFMKDVQALNPGGLIVIYRTSDNQGSAHYRSVATSICTVEEVKTRASFSTMDAYLEYCAAHSIFNRGDLINWYRRNGSLFIIKMTYNVALTKRLIRKVLLEELGIGSDYWGFFEISDDQFRQIIQKGQIDESIIIN